MMTTELTLESEEACAGFSASGCSAPLRFAYADPPYFGLAKKFYGHMHADAAEYDKLETHAALIERLNEYDGWAMSLHTPSVRHILPLCPLDVRLMAWVKPFASFKPGVGVAYAWEAIIVRGGRKRTRQQHTVRDWCACNITLKKDRHDRRHFPRQWCSLARFGSVENRAHTLGAERQAERLT